MVHGHYISWTIYPPADGADGNSGLNPQGGSRFFSFSPEVNFDNVLSVLTRNCKAKVKLSNIVCSILGLQ